MARGPSVERVVCLANSRKLSGRCLAGVVVRGSRTGVWIRPVSDRPHQEVSEEERRYQDGSDPRLLDVIDIPLLEHQPNQHQPENWLLDDRYYWQRVDTFPRDRLHELLEDDAGDLWALGEHSTSGLNDRVPSARDVDRSLRLVSVPELTLAVDAFGRAFGNRKRSVRARFEHAGAVYFLSVTDPEVERELLQAADGEYPVGPAILTVSLGEPYEGYCYKLVAAVFRA